MAVTLEEFMARAPSNINVAEENPSESDIENVLLSEIYSFTANIAEESRSAAADRSGITVDIFIEVHSVTSYDEVEEFERAIRESAAAEEQVVRTVPAAKSAIEALKEVNDPTTTTNERCSICLEELLLSFDHAQDHYRDQELLSFDEHGHNRRVLQMPCSHIYHKDCIAQWLETNHLCPLCRYAMPTTVSSSSSSLYD